MERGCPYLYIGSKFRVIWPSVLIIQRGVATTPLRKICLGKTLRRTRVKYIHLSLNLKLGLIDQALLLCPMVINNTVVPPLTVRNFITPLFFMWKKNKHDTQYISDPPSGENTSPLNTLTKIEHPCRTCLFKRIYKHHIFLVWPRFTNVVD